MDPQLVGVIVIAVPLTVRALVRAINVWSEWRVKIKAAQEKVLLAQAAQKTADADAAIKHAEADKINAETDKINAETASSAVAEFRKRLDACEKSHAEQDKTIAKQNATIASMQVQRDLDNALVIQLGEKAERDESLIRGLKAEVDRLGLIVKSGGVYAS